jgi:hypothetical protein
MRGMMSDRRPGAATADYSRGRRAAPVITVATTDQNRGFVITMTGYSPYKEIGKLLDPPGVQDDTNKWGVATRLMDMNSMFEGSSPFEIYKKTDKQHFEIRTGNVDLEAEMPPGTGARKVTEGINGEQIVELIDPMTKEVISKQAVADNAGKKVTDKQGKDVYQTNDQWFVLNLKLKWKGAPGPAAEPEASVVAEAPQESPPPPPPPPPPENRGGGRDRTLYE